MMSFCSCVYKCWFVHHKHLQRKLHDHRCVDVKCELCTLHIHHEEMRLIFPLYFPNDTMSVWWYTTRTLHIFTMKRSSWFFQLFFTDDTMSMRWCTMRTLHIFTRKRTGSNIFWISSINEQCLCIGALYTLYSACKGVFDFEFIALFH